MPQTSDCYCTYHFDFFSRVRELVPRLEQSLTNIANQLAQIRDPEQQEKVFDAYDVELRKIARRLTSERYMIYVSSDPLLISL